jgi:hypothetical protein
MCATSPDGTTVEFLRPPPGSQPGERVYFEGFEGICTHTHIPLWAVPAGGPATHRRLARRGP